ncbi:MAG: peptidylprolyl isomerase [Candidatus Omnitrophica bacterium]|nr:peptidylprolyl isomerase [Candidatus Omnitrophota bacterium]MDD5429283.1 peptidylprolyl isomerase [Candidatus Omnitrophota bacterium]
MIRDKHAKRILWGLLLVILPAFVLWGGISSLRGKKKARIGTIANREITSAQFNDSLKMAQLYLLLSPGDSKKISRVELENLGLDFMVLLWKAEKDNITASNEEVANYIINVFFQGKKFDKSSYNNFLKIISRRYNLNLSPRNFEEYIRKFIMIDKLFAKYVNVDIKDSEVKELYLRDNQKAKIAYLLIPYNRFKFDSGVTSAELEEFYDENTQLFHKEPKVNIAYLLIDEKDSLGDETLKKLPKIKTLQDLETEFPNGIKETGLIGIDDPIDEIGWQPEINKIAFSLKINAASPLLQTERGLLIISKKEEIAGFTPPLSDIKNEVKNKMLENISHRETERFALAVLEKMNTGKTKNLKKIAVKEKIEYKETDYFKYYDYIEGLGLEPDVSEIVFSMDKEQIYEKPLLFDNGAYIIQLIDILDFNEKDFEKKKQAYIDVILKSKVIERKIRFLDEIRKEAQLQAAS